uniref:Uncharacterized protein n=1 Tax=Tetraselmis sp. GSL018 TaxID=582737 RepID=A0A061RPB2_9CHLO|eukprot:CAMPEP_0177617844 /NCGR_PEP_ID=MMETSP0419_2-20121207/25175_1 /TAXON_ID=582737 /ORGANISM="Tetraselmis sp., Strain GSL018" /LENGTH=225 /DNA_ID=CAMNT_0019116535 /DNA_START=766 /DNA_END=1443 /DNA_ORIENTATION=-
MQQGAAAFRGGECAAATSGRPRGPAPHPLPGEDSPRAGRAAEAEELPGGGTAVDAALEEFFRLRLNLKSLSGALAEGVCQAKADAARGEELLAKAQSQAHAAEARAARLQEEIDTSRRLQRLFEKASRIPRHEASRELHKLRVRMSGLEQEIASWRGRTEEARSALSDQLAENCALRKQLFATEDFQRMILQLGCTATQTSASLGQSSRLLATKSVENEASGSED